MRGEEIGAGARTERDIRSGDSSEILSAIREPGVSLCTWQRQPPAELVRFLGRVAASEPFALEAYDTLEALRIDSLLDGFLWSADPGRALWIEEIHALLALFRDLRPEARERPLHLKVGVVDRIECPVFHTDWVSLRLICTYAGVGTEYAPDRSVNRDALCCPLATPAQTNAAIVREAAAIRQMAPFEVGLFKGCAYPGQGERGIVHRSPHPGKGMRRIKLIVDSTAPIV